MAPVGGGTVLLEDVRVDGADTLDTRDPER